jgi:hypothetical protein
VPEWHKIHQQVCTILLRKLGFPYGDLMSIDLIQVEVSGNKPQTFNLRGPFKF